jgi:hypothetical protein
MNTYQIKEITMSKYQSQNDNYPNANRLTNVMSFEVLTTTWPNEGMPSREQQLGLTMDELRREYKMSQPDEIVGIAISSVTFGDELSISTPHIIPIETKLSAVSDKTLDALLMSRSSYEAQAISLPDAMWQMRTFGSEAESLPVWACWGDYPSKKIRRDCERVKVRHPFSSRMINTKVIASLAAGLGVDLSMSQIVDEIDLSPFISEHIIMDFADQARNIENNTFVSAAIVAWCLR